MQAFSWTEEDVNTRLKNIMTRSFGEVYDLYKKENTSMRMAAYMLAVGRVAEATEIRGIYP